MTHRMIIELHLRNNGNDPYEIAGDLLPVRRTDSDALAHANSVEVEMGHIADDGDVDDHNGDDQPGNANANANGSATSFVGQIV